MLSTEDCCDRQPYLRARAAAAAAVAGAMGPVRKTSFAIIVTNFVVLAD